MPFSFENLEVYRRTMDFCVSVIDVVDQLDTPRKHYRLIEQLESSSKAVALNISEGKGRFSKKEFKQFLYIARGSLYETVAMLQIFKKKALAGSISIHQAIFTGRRDKQNALRLNTIHKSMNNNP